MMGRRIFGLYISPSASNSTGLPFHGMILLTHLSQFSHLHSSTALWNTHLSPQSNMTIHTPTSKCGKFAQLLGLNCHLLTLLGILECLVETILYSFRSQSLRICKERSEEKMRARMEGGSMKWSRVERDAL